MQLRVSVLGGGSFGTTIAWSSASLLDSTSSAGGSAKVPGTCGDNAAPDR